MKALKLSSNYRIDLVLYRALKTSRAWTSEHDVFFLSEATTCTFPKDFIRTAVVLFSLSFLNCLFSVFARFIDLDGFDVRVLQF